MIATVAHGLRLPADVLHMIGGTAELLYEQDSIPCHTSPSVLVVDDDESFRDLAKAILEARGYHVRLASSFSDALSELQRMPAHAVVLDIVMPDTDGFEALPALRAASNSARIITVSGARNSDVYLEVAARLGADAALQKCDIHLLSGALDRLLRC